MPVSELIGPFFSSRTLNYVLWLAILAGAYAGIPLVVQFYVPDWNNIPSEFHAALSLVLGWLLVFRTNTAYSRWWEARTLWGALVNTSRNAAIKFLTIGRFTESEQQQAWSLIKAFPYALKWHLRGEPLGELDSQLITFLSSIQHRPQAITRRLYETCRTAQEDSRLTGEDYRIMDAELSHLLNICGACERILKTRIVRSYRIFARQCVLIFLATLPWGIVSDFGPWTIPMTIISAYFMLGLETVAEHVEEPFGYDDDDLDLDGLCETISKTVDETATA